MNKLFFLKKVLFLVEEEMKHIQKKCFSFERKITELTKKKNLLKEYVIEYQEKIKKEVVIASYYKQQCTFLSQLGEMLAQQEKTLDNEKELFNQGIKLFQLKESKAKKIKEMIAKREQVLRNDAFKKETQKNTDVFNQATYITLKKNSSDTDL